MIPQDPPEVLISYTHDSDDHKEQVLQFSNRLIVDEGIQSWIDRYVEDASPSEGWPAWMSAKVRQSKFVLVVCTETYRHRFYGEAISGKGKGLGGRFESFLIQNQIYQDGTINEKFIPVVLQKADRAYIPAELQPYTNYCLTNAEEYEQLIRRLTKQPKIVRPQLGTIRVFSKTDNAPTITEDVDKTLTNLSPTATLTIEASRPLMIDFYQAMPPNLKLMQAFFERSYSARIALARKIGLLESGEPESVDNKDHFSAQLLLRAQEKNALGNLWHLMFDETVDPNPYQLV